MKTIDLKGAKVIVSDIGDGNTVSTYQPHQDSQANHIEFLRKASEKLGVEVGESNTFGWGLPNPFSNTVYELTDEMAKEHEGNLWGYDVPKDSVYKGKTDSVITNVPGIWTGTGYADCVPGVLYDPNKNAMANLHLGRDNIECDLERAAIEAMLRTYGTSIKDLHVYLGPAIAPEFYIQEHVSKLKHPKWNGHILETSKGFELDIKGAVVSRLLGFGIDPKNMIVSDEDTYTNPNYFSHTKATEDLARIRRVVLEQVINIEDSSEDKELIGSLMKAYQEKHGAPKKLGRFKVYSSIQK